MLTKIISTEQGPLVVLNSKLKMLSANKNVFIEPGEAEVLMENMLILKLTGTDLRAIFATINDLEFLYAPSKTELSDRDPEKQKAMVSVWSCLEGLNSSNKGVVLKKLGRDFELLGFTGFSKNGYLSEESVKAFNGNNFELVIKLLEKGADFNKKDNFDQTAIIYAVRKWINFIENSTEPDNPTNYEHIKNIKRIINSLLSRGANINDKDSSGKTAFFYAIGSANEDAVDFLLSKKPDLDIKAKDGSTALMSALKDYKYDMALKLIEAGANPDTLLDEQDDTPLIYIAWNFRRPYLIEALINAGANINAANKRGITPLIAAVRNNDFESVKLLVEAGAEKSLRDNEDMTAWYWARHHGNEEMMVYLDP
ncbi:MAG: ankyrin repeat domain-containing protein [Candidatus Margulisbacteria bacterium]|nr:ankyrin repeat domain-containing protein [Candidatus Margulisiibacteriota bacterium]